MREEEAIDSYLQDREGKKYFYAWSFQRIGQGNHNLRWNSLLRTIYTRGI